jgi:alkylation response protein AidB-like acyl-CoA dehydrogenase
MPMQISDISLEPLRAEVREFAEQVVRPAVPAMESSGDVAYELSRQIARQGWIGVTIPHRYGGMGLGQEAKTVIIAEMSRVSGAMGAMIQASQLGVAKILHFGTEEQKHRFLPPVGIGASLPTIATTEAQSGGHVLGMTGSAVPDGDGYRVTATKCFVGNSHVGDLHGIIVRTGPGSNGLTAFLVESDRPGVRTAQPFTPAGLRGFSFGDVVMEDVWVPTANRLGSEGTGLAVAYSSSVLYGRANLAAVALGIHRAVVEDTARFLSTRVLYGAPLSALDSMKQRLGAMESRLVTAEVALFDAVRRLDRGEACDALLLNAKLINVDLALDSARAAVEMFGARGVHTEFGVERYLRDATCVLAPAGTPDIQRLRLAGYALAGVGAEKSRADWSEKLSDAVRLRPERHLRAA